MAWPIKIDHGSIFHSQPSAPEIMLHHHLSSHGFQLAETHTLCIMKVMAQVPSCTSNKVKNIFRKRFLFGTFCRCPLTRAVTKFKFDVSFRFSINGLSHKKHKAYKQGTFIESWFTAWQDSIHFIYIPASPFNWHSCCRRNLGWDIQQRLERKYTSQGP